MMRTREVLRWHQSVRDLQELVLIACAGLALGVLDRACLMLEAYLDRDGAR